MLILSIIAEGAMGNSASKEEREKFSERLRHSLSAAGFNSQSPTQVQRGFNLLDPASQVTVHGARKWIVGESIPTQRKLRLLADWLGVSAAWLRFGDATEQQPTTKRSDRLRDHEIKLLTQLRSLSADDAMLVTKLIRRLASNTLT